MLESALPPEYINLNQPSGYVVAAKAAASRYTYENFNPNKKFDKVDLVGLGDLREQAVVEEGLRVGAGLGFNYRVEMLSKIIEKHSSHLDRIADFSQFVVDGRVLVPSVQLVERSFDQIDELSQVEVNVSFTVNEEAALIYQKPTYRDYILLNKLDMKAVDFSLRPRNNEEVELWKNAIERGFVAGVARAEALFADGLAELHEDITGRVMYLSLVSLKMIEPVSLSVTDNGITFNDRTMNVGEVVYSLEQDPSFTASDGWRSVWSIGQEMREIRSNAFLRAHSIK